MSPTIIMKDERSVWVGANGLVFTYDKGVIKNENQVPTHLGNWLEFTDSGGPNRKAMAAMIERLGIDESKASREAYNRMEVPVQEGMGQFEIEFVEKPVEELSGPESVRKLEIEFPGEGQS